jgi:hypothetical protein
MDQAEQEKQIGRFVRHLSARGEQSYAVLDAARGYRVHQAVRWSGRPYRSLYRGPMPPELEQAAPYLVELGEDHSFTRRVLTEGWGASWGFFAVAPVGFVEMRTHLRTLLRAQSHDGQRFMFRFYDPRVLRVYLPTCTPQELHTFFGPVTRFIVEEAGGPGAVAFERRQGELLVSKLDLGTVQ